MNYWRLESRKTRGAKAHLFGILVRMNVTVLYTRKTPADRHIEYLQRKLQEEERIEAKLLDADSREGIALAELYGIMQRPALLVTDGEGKLAAKWEGELPIAQRVADAYRGGI